jgi:hypothetical protein
MFMAVFNETNPMGSLFFFFFCYRSLDVKELFYDIRYQIPTELSNIPVRAHVKKFIINANSSGTLWFI